MTIGRRFKVVDCVVAVPAYVIAAIVIARWMPSEAHAGFAGVLAFGYGLPWIMLGATLAAAARGVIWYVYRHGSAGVRQEDMALRQLAGRSDVGALRPLLDAVWPTPGVPEGTRDAALHAIRAHLERIAVGEPCELSRSQVTNLDGILVQQLAEISAQDLDTQRARRVPEPPEELQLALAILRAYPHVGAAAQLRRVERLARSRRSASGPGMKQVRAAAAAAVEPLRERLRTRNTRERLLRPAAPDTGEGLLRPAVAAQDGADRQLLRAAVADERMDAGVGSVQE